MRGRLGTGTAGVGLLVLAMTWSTSGRAETYTVTPADDLEAAINALEAGDELVVGGGSYLVTERFSIQIAGTEDEPIVIRAADGEVPVIDQQADQNIIDIEDSAHVVLRGLEAVHGSRGLRINNSSFVTIEQCHIHDTGDLAISANDPGSSYQGLRLVRNHIHHTNGTGEGMYLGCNNNGCQVHHSLIEGNYIHHTDGADVEQGDGIEIKEGSHDNVVRDNVIHHTKYPCILTYSVVGNGGPNLIERNTLWSCGDYGIQSAQDSIIRNNIILSAGSGAIGLQPHQAGAPADQQIVHNTILQPGGTTAVRASGIVGSLIVANNAIYAESGHALHLSGDLGAVVVSGNVGAGTTQGVSGGFDDSGSLAADFVDASFSGTVPNDVFPTNGSALVGAGDVAYVVADDFNGTDRGGVADVGAYWYDAAGNPGWILQEGFKDPGGSSGGGGTAAAGPGGAGGAGGGGAGGSGTSAGGAAPSRPAEQDAGCGCRTTGRGHGGAGLLALGLGLSILRRRRRSPPCSCGCCSAAGTCCVAGRSCRRSRAGQRRSGPVASNVGAAW